MKAIRTAFLHYSAPPIVGGVEAVMLAHAREFMQAGYPVTMIAGRGGNTRGGEGQSGIPEGVETIILDDLDSQNPVILEAGRDLDAGRVPDNFDDLVLRIAKKLREILPHFDHLIVHNIFTKHFNLPLTAALVELLQAGELPPTTAWCHDLTWTSPNSRSKVHPGYPWDLLRTYYPCVNYVTVSQERKLELVTLMNIPEEKVKVIYNGVDEGELLGLSPQTVDLARRMSLLDAELVLLMPVRVTQAKNIEYALETAARLKSRVDLRLIVTGPPDPHDEKNLDYYRSLLRLRDSLSLEKEMCFLYELGEEGSGLTVGMDVVSQLFRLSDLVLMPSHREGFGMPVLEAGLTGLPVFCTAFPAAVEIAEGDVTLIDPANPGDAAEKITGWMEASSIYQLKRKVRLGFTWKKIFKTQIEPILIGEKV